MLTVALKTPAGQIGAEGNFRVGDDPLFIVWWTLQMTPDVAEIGFMPGTKRCFRGALR